MGDEARRRPFAHQADEARQAPVSLRPSVSGRKLGRPDRNPLPGRGSCASRLSPAGRARPRRPGAAGWSRLGIFLVDCDSSRLASASAAGVARWRHASSPNRAAGDSGHAAAEGELPRPRAEPAAAARRNREASCRPRISLKGRKATHAAGLQLGRAFFDLDKTVRPRPSRTRMPGAGRAEISSALNPWAGRATMRARRYSQRLLRFLRGRKSRRRHAISLRRRQIGSRP